MLHIQNYLCVSKKKKKKYLPFDKFECNQNKIYFGKKEEEINQLFLSYS